MSRAKEELTTKFKVGLFTLFGLILTGVITVFVNDKPFWWRPCQLVYISINDATGLKTKSPVKSRGLQIGYLSSVELSETKVKLGICVTAPVEVIPTTRAYIKGEGFLGDKYVDLKPVRYIGSDKADDEPEDAPKKKKAKKDSSSNLSVFPMRVLAEIADFASTPSFAADEPAKAKSSKEIPVGDSSQDIQELVDEVDDMVVEIKNLTSSLKDSFNPVELRQTINKLNVTLENASRTFSPEGNLTSTAQRVLAKLEDSIEQMRDQMIRVNQGQGSVGKVLNDEWYAEELKKALKSLNELLGGVGGFQFIVDLGSMVLPVYEGSRSFFNLYVWPNPTRYYLIGATFDPRGQVSSTTTITEVGGQSTTAQTTQINRGGFLFTAMVGKRFWNRLDLSVGARYGDGTLSVALMVGPNGKEDMFELRNDFYAQNEGFNGVSRTKMDYRGSLIIRPKIGLGVYLQGGLDSIRKINNKVAYHAGGGISFTDDDIKFLVSLL